MANTALNRTVVSLLTNKSGGNLAYGDVVIIDTANAKAFTTTTTAGYSTTGVGVIIEPNGIASNATGLVATDGWVPQVNLNTAATIGQFIKTHTVAGQATPHGTQAAGDFGYALQASATPEAILWGGPNPSSGTGTVTHTGGALTSGQLVVGAGSDDLAVGDLSGDVSTSGGTATTIGAAKVAVSMLTTGAKTGTMLATIDGGGSAITTGIKGDLFVPIAVTITQATTLADQSGSIVIDIWKDSYANFPPTVADTITASAKPTLSTATKAQDSTLTGWTTSVTAGDILRFNVDSASTVTRVLLALDYTKA